MSESKWVRFENQSPLSGRTTPRYFVINKAGNFRLGVVQWENRWRQYVFAPDDHTIYARSCLDDVSQFLASLRVGR